MPGMMTRAIQNKSPGNEIVQRDVQIETKAVDEASRSVDLSFSSEDAYERYFGPEILGHSPGEVELGRLQAIGVALWNHHSDIPIGRLSEIRLDESTRKCRAKVTFDDDPESDRIFRKVKSGTLRGVSVGYRVNVWEEVKAGKTSTCGRHTGPCWIARKWEPLEVSVVSVPADATVGVGRQLEPPKEEAAMDELEKARLAELEKRKSDEAAKTKADEIAAAKKVAEENAARAIEADRVRVSEIMDLARNFNMDLTQQIKDGTSVDAVRKLIVDEQIKSRKPIEGGVRVETEERDKFRAAVRDGILLRAGKAVKTPAPGANDFRSYTAMELARECLRQSGQPYRNGSGDIYAVIDRAMTTSDFPVLLGETFNLSLMQGWDSVPETWQTWVATGSVNDFKKNTIARPGEHKGDLDPLPEGAEYKFTEKGETFEEYQIFSYGKMSGVTRQAIINDSLNAIQDEFTLHGEAARRKIGDLAYAALTDNPNMADNVPLFHSTHANLAGTAGHPSADFQATIALMDTSFTAMKNQKDIGGKRRIGAIPRFIIVPDALLNVTERFFGAANVPMEVTSGKTVATGLMANNYFGRVTVVSDLRLDDSSTTAWYLAAEKGKTVKMWFLNGVQTPYLEQQQGWYRDMLEFKVRIDAGAKAVDYRGLYKNAGA